LTAVEARDEGLHHHRSVVGEIDGGIHSFLKGAVGCFVDIVGSSADEVFMHGAMLALVSDVYVDVGCFEKSLGMLVIGLALIGRETYSVRWLSGAATVLYSDEIETVNDAAV